MKPVIISRDDYLAMRDRIKVDYRVLSDHIRQNKRGRADTNQPEIIRRLMQSNVAQLSRAAKSTMARLEFFKRCARLSVDTAKAMEASAS